MSIRLNTALRELNIGMQTAVTYLKKFPELGPVLEDLSFKLSDEQYNALIDKFVKGRDSHKRTHKEENKLKNDTNVSSLKNEVSTIEENETQISVNEAPQAIIQDGSVIFSLNAVAAWLKVDKEELINFLSSISKEFNSFSQAIPGYLYAKVLEHYGERINKVNENPQSKQVVSTTKIERNIYQKSDNVTVLGKIDLSSINLATRPKRNFKTEEENKRQQQAVSIVESDSKTIFKEDIKDVWENYVQIQEQIVQQRSAPIQIYPDSAVVRNDKLIVKVDDSFTERTVENIFKDKLKVDKYDLSNGYILVDEDVWGNLSENDLSKITSDLSECYVQLETTPSISATINYGERNNGTLENLSLNQIREYNKQLQNNSIIEGNIDEKVACIAPISIKMEGFLHYLFGEHFVVVMKKDKKTKELKPHYQFIYNNKYIPLDAYKSYQESIGLKCKSFKIAFRIKDIAAVKYLKVFDTYDPEKNAFFFNYTFPKGEDFDENTISMIDENIKVFLNEARQYCRLEDIEVGVRFTYCVKKSKIIDLKFKETELYVRNHEGMSFNDVNGKIGIDFNWKENDIEEKIHEFENNVSFVTINRHEDHKYKCSVNVNFVGFNLLKDKLKEDFTNISVTNDSIHQQIKISLPYTDTKFYNSLRSILEEDLSPLKAMGLEVNIQQKEEGKVRLGANYNEASRIEDIEERLSEMKKADFGIQVEEKEIHFGTLIKSNYPQLTFDIDIENDETKKSIEDAFENHAVSTIVPILTGDIEKISRLKKTFTQATKGEGLINPNLQNFIFDSSLAKPTKDISFFLRKDGTPYIDLCHHLLNTNINESQKQAIIKAMYADDMAVIQGPPGTGKSTAIAELLWQLIRKGLEPGNKNEFILLTSETNLAVDNAISRVKNSKSNIVKPVRFGGEEKLEAEGLQFSIELMKKWVDEGDSVLISDEQDEETGENIKNDLILKEWLQNIANRSFMGMPSDENEIINKWRQFLFSPDKDLRQSVYENYISNCNVIGATCSSIGDQKADKKGYTPFFYNYCEVVHKDRKRAQISFTTVIQDESSKATPAELVLPFVYGKRAIVIGDHRQLPPMLDQEDFETTLEHAYNNAKSKKEKESIVHLQKFISNNFKEMEISHFQRLYENIDDSLKGTFNLQYRMHPDINEVIEQFYREDGGLKCGLITPVDLGVDDPDVSNPASRYHGINIPGLISPENHVLFIDTESPEMQDGFSRINYGEINIVDKILRKFSESDSFHAYLEKFSKEEDRQVGIISFYGKQVRQLRNIARQHTDIPTRVSTVDRFQGMERNIVIVSMVRSDKIESSMNQEPDFEKYPQLGYPRQNSLGFAQSPNRLNVALSRAKRLLIIVGNQKHFSNLEIYRRLFLVITNNAHDRVLSEKEL